MAEPVSPSQAAKNLNFELTPEVADRLRALQDAVRKAGHSRPSQKVMVEALIWAADTSDGRKLELKVLAPYRDDHPKVDR